MQPILQYGVLIYGTAAKNDIKKLNNKIKHLVELYMGNVSLSQLKTSELQQKFNIEELHLYELLKLVI